MGKGIMFFDIDGTLCRYGGRVTESVKEAFHRFHERGNIAYLCTGRSPADIGTDILNLGFEGIIGCMGAVIIDNGVVLQNEYIPYEMLEETVDALLQYKAAALILGKDEVLRTEYIEASELETGVVCKVEDLYRDGRLPKISSFDIEYESFRETAPYINLLQKHSELVQYTDMTGQTRLRGVDKAKAIQKVLSLPKYRGKTSYAIGDSQNDIEMLEQVDVGIAMGDAPEKTIACAQWQTATVEEDGVCRALEHFALV